MATAHVYNFILQTNEAEKDEINLEISQMAQRQPQIEERQNENATAAAEGETARFFAILLTHLQNRPRQQ